MNILNNLFIFKSIFFYLFYLFNIKKKKGIFVSLFIRLNIRAQAYRRSTFLKYIRIIETTFMAFITSVVSYFVIYMR